MRALSSVVLRTQPDERLAALVAEGSEAAFEAIVNRYRRPLHAYCRRLLLSETRSEDAVQQALMNAWTSMRSGTEVRQLRPWLYRITHNQAMAQLRSPELGFDQLTESLSPRDAPERELERRILMRETLAAVAALPHPQREVILRTAIDGQSYEQVAAALGITDTSVRGLAHRARRSLRAGLAVAAPGPLVTWAAGQARRGGDAAQRITEILGGGGTAGGAVALKGAAVIATSVAVAGGTFSGALALHPTPPPARARPASTQPVRASRTSATTPSASAPSTSAPRALLTAAAPGVGATAEPIGHGVRAPSYAVLAAASRPVSLSRNDPRRTQPAWRPSLRQDLQAPSYGPDAPNGGGFTGQDSSQTAGRQPAQHAPSDGATGQGARGAAPTQSRGQAGWERGAQPAQAQSGQSRPWENAPSPQAGPPSDHAGDPRVGQDSGAAQPPAGLYSPPGAASSVGTASAVGTTSAAGGGSPLGGGSPPGGGSPGVTASPAGTRSRPPGGGRR